MKRWLASLLLLGAACGTSSKHTGPPPGVRLVHPEQRPQAAAAASAPASDVYTFEGVEVFGVRTRPREQVLALFSLPAPGTPVRAGQQDFIDQLIASKQRLAALEPWRFLSLTVTQLDTHAMFVTADVVESGDAWRMPFDAEPTGDVPDPDGLGAAWKDYQTRLGALRRQGAMPVFGEGTCRALVCHGGFGHPELAPLEPRFVDGVPHEADALVRVLREDANAEKRYVALLLLPYVPRREWLLEAVLPSVRDPDRGVRNEALRLLGVLQKDQPRAVVPLEPVLEALWYPTGSDRNKAGWALVYLLRAEGPERRARILARSGEALLQMFQMKNAIDHEPAHDALALLAGEDLGEDVAAWRAWAARQGVSADPR